MALPAKLFRFRIELSDIDRGLYTPLDFRLAMHPSESTAYLLTRAIAFAASYDEELEISPQGLADPESPAMKLIQPETGRISLWIEIGNPSSKKLHKAAKASTNVRIYTYKDPTLIQKECQGESIHRSEEIEIFGVSPKMIEHLEQDLSRDIRWSLLIQEGEITLNWGTQHFTSELKRYSLR